MSRIASSVKEIKDLSFEPLPSYPITPVKFAHSKSDRVIVMIGLRGTIYTDAVSSGVLYLSNPCRFGAVLKILAKMKIISKEGMKEHMAMEASREKVRDNKYAANSIRNNAKKLGITLTKEQTKVIDKAIREGRKL